MKHQVNTRTFGRRPEARKALLRGLSDQLIEHGRISTTLIRAKELRRMVEPLVTLAKKGDLHSRRQAAAVLYKKETLQKLFDEVGPKFQSRAGGYTRIIRTGVRAGDAAPCVFIEFVGSDATVEKTKKKAAPKKAVAKEAKAKESAPAKAVKKEKAAAIDEATKALGKKVFLDDLKIIEGIGPKIADLYHAAGITTWAQLAMTSESKSKEVLATGGDKFKMHDPKTWAKQAEMADQGKWKELKIYQDELDGGKTK